MKAERGRAARRKLERGKRTHAHGEEGGRERGGRNGEEEGEGWREGGRRGRERGKRKNVASQAFGPALPI